MGDGNHLGLRLERLDNLLVCGNAADGAFDLGDLGAVHPKTLGERVTKVASVENDLNVSLAFTNL